MKLNKILVAAASLTFAAGAFAANPVNQGGGDIEFKGSIIEAPCSIDYDLTDDVVQLGQVSDSLLSGGGKSHSVPFKIVLKDCNNATLKNVTTTFGGTASTLNADLLGMSGNAEGASIAIVDASGALIKLGTPSAAHILTMNENTLKFNAYLQGDATATVKPGTFSSTASYSLSYQ